MNLAALAGGEVHARPRQAGRPVSPTTGASASHVFSQHFARNAMICDRPERHLQGHESSEFAVHDVESYQAVGGMAEGFRGGGEDFESERLP